MQGLGLPVGTAVFRNHCFQCAVTILNNRSAAFHDWLVSIYAIWLV